MGNRKELNIVLKNDLVLPQKRYLEIIERKSIGHPDTLADGIAESVSIDYSLYCLNNFGVILHHNFDKIYIGGGKIDVDFGRGEIIKPVILNLNGRVSKSFGDKKIDNKRILEKAAKKYISKVLPYMDIDNGLKIHFSVTDHSVKPYWFNPRDIKDIPDATEPIANDTSNCVSFWPPSPIEETTLKLENFFYNEKGYPRFEFVGQDIKIMAIRKEKKVSFVVTIPFIAKKTPDGDFYRETVRKFQKELNLIVQETVGSQYKTKVYLNSEKGHYLLLGGSCVELGEEGVVGRGNKTRGLISGMRPYTMETPYGKNPVYHVGKVYATITDYLSRAISEHFDCSCNVNIITRIGDNLYSPYQIFIETNKSIKRRKVHNLVRETLEDRCWTERILNERLLVPKVGKQNLTKLLLGGL